MAVTTLAAIAIVGTFNVLVDPLGVFGSPRISGFNATKPHLDHHRELSHWQAAHRLCPNVGIFGNSRAEIGFDPHNPIFENRGFSAFNHAIPGTAASLAYNQLLWLQAANCMPKTIILNVEFFDFLGGSPTRSLPTVETAPPPRIDGRLLAEAVFSITGFRDSINTFLLQFSRYPATLTNRGFNPLYNYTPEVRQNGHYVLFRQRAEENIRNWTRKAPRLQPAEGIISEDEQMVDAILTLATASDSTVHVVIYPYHAEIRMLIERLDLGGLFADWKKSIVNIAARHTEQGQKIEVWDFSGITQETLEAIPKPGDRNSQLTYYWEAGHFKKALGDLMIARILGDQNTFGVNLNKGNVTNWLIEDRTRVQVLLTAPSPLLIEVDDLFANQSKK